MWYPHLRYEQSTMYILIKKKTITRKCLFFVHLHHEPTSPSIDTSSPMHLTLILVWFFRVHVCRGSVCAPTQTFRGVGSVSGSETSMESCSQSGTRAPFPSGQGFGSGTESAAPVAARSAMASSTACVYKQRRTSHHSSAILTLQQAKPEVGQYIITKTCQKYL